jgi:N-acetylmuramoyl-L-alanine amidase
MKTPNFILLYIRDYKTTAFRLWMELGRSVFRSRKPSRQRRGGASFSVCLLFVVLLSGCATVPMREALSTYNLNGTTYLALISLCDQRNIAWQYDTYTRTVNLNKDSHKIKLRAGDAFVIVDGVLTHINKPVDIYQGTIVVPYAFKEQVIDVLFKQGYPERKPALPLLKVKKIVIDAGHGGRDPGTIGMTGLREKDVNLDIAKRLTKLLVSCGAQVVMTRNTDTFIPLAQRAEIANNSRADIFISIHSNANRVRSLSGFEIYYVSGRVNDSKRSYEAAKNVALNLDSACFASNSLNLKAILWDMIYTCARAEAIELSRSICRALDSNLEVKNLGIKDAGYQVLRETRMPAVLIEVGFLSNHNEERRLKNSYYRQKIADGILEGIRNYAQDNSFAEMASR